MAEESHATHAFEALVTHVVDADKFFVQLYNESERKKLLVIENGLISTNPKPLQKPARIDDYLAVKLIDRGFKRARLLKPVQHSVANVQLIDYGNEEAVPENCIFQLPSELGTDALREQAIKCAIVGIKVNQQVNSLIMKDLLCNHKVNVTAYCISPQGELLVDIQTASQASIRHLLTLKGSCTPTNVSHAPWTPRPGAVVVNYGQKLPVIISHVNDLADFYVQLKTMDAKFRHMMGRLKSVFGNQSQSHATQINIGMLCCVHLGVEWFRAEIVQVLLNGLILVQLVDFGNYQHVTMTQIYPLEGSFLQQPYNAIRCSLNDIMPTTPTLTGAFPKQLVQWFNRYVREEAAQFFATFVKESDNRYQIELFNEAENPNGDTRKSTIELLIENDCARRVTSQPPKPMTSTRSGGMQAQLNQMSQ